MTLTMSQFNALTNEEARVLLLQCCGSLNWAAAVIQRRPFASYDELCKAADDIWLKLNPEDWIEAFGQHPRIGDRTMDCASQFGTGSWARKEQSGVATATDQARLALVEGNKAYEDRFGHVFLICATGKTADEMLAALRHRMNNEPKTELRIAAEHQAMITRLRLEKLLQP